MFVLECVCAYRADAVPVIVETESDVRIRDLCGVCLGEVGAIDPARVGLRLRDGGAAEGAVSGGSGRVIISP